GFHVTGVPDVCSSDLAASQGAVASELYFNYQMGIGHTKPVPELRGAVVSHEFTEENARAYYRRWAQFMEGKSWDALMPDYDSPRDRKSVVEGKGGETG